MRTYRYNKLLLVSNMKDFAWSTPYASFMSSYRSVCAIANKDMINMQI